MSTKRFTIGQAIFWISRVTKAGEPRYRVPGHVVNITSKRITILVQQTDGKGFVRHVTARRLTPGNLAPLLPSQIRQSMAQCKLD